MGEGNKYALVVACDLYADPELKQLQTPPKDARALQGILENPKIGGFRVESLINQPYWIVREKINEFIQSCGREDTFLLYFSCHGIKDKGGHLYFATINTNRKLLYATGIESNFVNNMLDQCRAQQKVVLLDCCYSGAFGKEGVVVRADKQVNATEFFGRGSVVITASDSMQYSFEDDKIKSLRTGSYFTSALVEGLENGKADVNNDGKITYSELYDYVYDYVKNITPDQTPTLNTHGVQGDFVIFKNIRESLSSNETETSASKGSSEDPGKLQINDPILGFIEEARISLENEEYDRAIKTFDGILMLRPGHIEALNGKGVALCNQEKYKEALQCFKEVLKIRPKHPEASTYVKIIENRMKKESSTEVNTSGKYVKQDTTALEKRTEEKVIKALNESKQIPSYWIKKGDYVLAKGMYEEAILRYDKALEIDTNSADAWNKKGVSLHKLGRYNEAITCYDKALKISPERDYVWTNKGNALYDLGRYNEAITCYDKALKISPEYYYALTNKGVSLHVLGRYNEAITCYDKALKITLFNDEPWNNKGLSLYKLGKYMEAIECYDEALKVNPRYSLAWYNKGLALGALGKKDEARECYEKAKELGYDG